MIISVKPDFAHRLYNPGILKAWIQEKQLRMR